MSMIIAGPFCECVKTGVYFSVNNDDRLFTGDLFYDIAKKEFQIRGIPTYNGKKTHAIPVSERGPFLINLYVIQVTEEAVRPTGEYTDIRFKIGKISENLLTWIEEWYSDMAILQVIRDTWIVEKNLAWVKG